MQDFFKKMNEDYAKKHFPTGSIFESMLKTVKRGTIGFFFLFGIFLIGASYGLVWSIGRTMEFMSNGEKDMIGICIGICIFFLLIVLGILFLFRFVIKKNPRNKSDYIKEVAKISELSLTEIEAFERQVLASDCYILNFKSGLDKVLSNDISKDGFLTRDYIYIPNNFQLVMRVDALRACCFSEYSYYITVGRRRKKIHNLQICLIASNGHSVSSETTEKAGKALISILKERNSLIDTNDGKVLKEGAFDKYKQKVLQRQ